MADTETFGTIIFLGDSGSPTIYSEIVGVTSVPTFSSGSRSTIDTSEISDTTKQFLAGMFDPGEMTFDIKWDPRETTHGSDSGLYYMSKTRGTFNFVAKIPASTSGGAAQFVYFVAVVTGFNITAPQEDVYRASVTLKISGDWVINTTAPATS